jgi:hypothetical protein
LGAQLLQFFAFNTNRSPGNGVLCPQVQSLGTGPNPKVDLFDFYLLGAKMLAQLGKYHILGHREALKCTSRIIVDIAIVRTLDEQCSWASEAVINDILQGTWQLCFHSNWIPYYTGFLIDQYIAGPRFVRAFVYVVLCKHEYGLAAGWIVGKRN